MNNQSLLRPFVILTDGNSHPVLLVVGVSNKLAADSSLVLKFVFDFSHLEPPLKSPIVVMASVKKAKRGIDVRRRVKDKQATAKRKTLHEPLAGVPELESDTVVFLVDSAVTLWEKYASSCVLLSSYSRKNRDVPNLTQCTMSVY